MLRFSGVTHIMSYAVSLVSITASAAFAQQNLGGQVSGRVVDPSAAVITRAQVTAQNIATNVVTSTHSDNIGYYVLQVPVGVYTVRATAQGFETSTQQNVTVVVGGSVTLDFHLQVGSTSTEIQVNASVTPLINTTSSAVETSVDNALVSALPVEIAGSMRSATSFLELEPGYNASPSTLNVNGGASLNGGFPGDQETLVDGAAVSAVAFSSGGQGGAYGEVVPTFAVQEFRVIGANADAEYGRTATGAVTYVVKSGTNQFHGSAFEYVRNTDFDAKTYFEPTRGPDHQNEFGFDFGGPIQHNKTFFYGYYDGFRYSSANTGTIYSILTPEEKEGNFTAAGLPPIYDPSTGQQYSCSGVLNVICPNLISPVSTYYASLFPNPNLPGLTNNFVGTATTNSPSNEYLAKINHTFNASSNIMVSGSWQTANSYNNCTFGAALCGGTFPNHEIRGVADWDKLISASTLNHLYLNYVMDAFFSHGGDVASLTSGNNFNQNAGLANVDETGMAQISVGPYFLGNGNGINQITHQGVTLGDDLSWTHGSHQFKFGVQASRYYTIGLQQYGGPLGISYPYGDFSFSSAETALPGTSNTGLEAASFMLGEVDTGTFAQEPSQAWVMPYFAVYAQDSWKIRPNLTFNYGLRWDYSSPSTARSNNMSNFNPNLLNPGAGFLHGALEYAGYQPGEADTNSFAYKWFFGFGPRLGVAYAPKAGTVIRAAFGVMYDTNTQPTIFLDQQGYYAVSVLSSLNGGVTPAFNWNTGFPGVPATPNLVLTFANGTSTFYLPPNGMIEPMVENYNIGIQQKIWSGIVIDAAYVGTQGHRLYDGYLDMNQLNPAYLALGNTLDAQIGSAPAIAAGISSPYSGFNDTVAQALRPYPQYQEILILNDPVGKEHYNALQIRAQKELSQGLAFLMSYTYAKNYTNVNTNYGAQNYYNLQAELAPASYDITKAFTLGYTYQLPIGSGKLLKTSNKTADELVGGWETSGYINLQGGNPLQITTELSLPGMASTSVYTSSGTLRPNIVAGTPLYGPNASRGSFNPYNDSYINANAFTIPPAFTLGDAPAYFDNLRAFGIQDWDVALMKAFKLRERYSLNFKGEFFNVLNLHNFGPPNTDLNSPSFGTISNTTGTSRNGQLSLTLTF
jgi:hypothetical protein